jgi:regulatory protein
MADVRESAVRYLSVKVRTKQQVAQYLKRKGFDEDEIRAAVDELEECRYINDLEYSRLYFEYGFEKGRGISRIKRELTEKGVPSDIISRAFEELEYVPDQYDEAEKIAHGMLSGVDIDSLDYDGMRRLQAKIGRRLMSRGFSSDVVYRTINSIRK